MKRILLFISFSILFISCKTTQVKQPITRGVLAEHAMVVSARKEASQVGLAILKKEGTLLMP